MKPQEELMTPEEVCARWRNKIDKKTLANWRWRGRGPLAMKLGGRILYRIEDVVAWEKRNVVGGGL
jgi:predicted site-specific integrase-resolvase